jgi:hypothetical protein
VERSVDIARVYGHYDGNAITQTPQHDADPNLPSASDFPASKSNSIFAPCILTGGGRKKLGDPGPHHRITARERGQIRSPALPAGSRPRDERLPYQ